MNLGVTNINELPSNNNQNENIYISQMPSNTITQNEVISQNNNSMQNPNIYNPEISHEKNKENQNIYNEMVGQIQQISNNSNISIPSRDIPNNTNNIVQDTEIKPNYIPKQCNNDYIKNYETPESVINQKNENIKYENNIEFLYNEIQIPLLITLLYFIFNIPYFKKLLFKYLPKIFKNDGNYNIYGNITTSLLFGVIYYILIKFLDYIKL